MRLFILKTLGFVLVFALLTTFCTHCGKMYYCNVEYPMWKAQKEYLMKARANKNLVIGDSRALAGMSPPIIQNNFYNLSLGGATPIEGYYTLLQYLKHNRPQKIVLSYGPFHLRREEAFYERTVKFGFLSNVALADLFKVIKKERQTINGQPLLSTYDYYHYYWQYFLALNDFFPTFRTNFKRLFYNDAEYLHNKDIYREITSQEGQHYFGRNPYFDGLNQETQLDNFKEVSVIIDIYLKKIIDLALQNNIQVYYINTPFNEASVRQLKVDFVAEYNAYMKNLHTLYPQVIWHSDLHYYPNDCFGDRSHLNTKGNNIFSAYVRNIVEQK